MAIIQSTPSIPQQPRKRKATGKARKAKTTVASAVVTALSLNEAPSSQRSSSPAAPASYAARVGYMPSQYQADIFSWIERGAGNAVVNAVAGGGKSTVAVSGARFIPRSASAIFLAFNKHIAAALTDKLADTPMTARTIHSAGYSLVAAQLRGGRIQTDERKYQQIAKALTFGVRVTDEQRRELQHALVALGSKARATLTEPHDRDALDALCDYYSITLSTNTLRTLLLDLLPHLLKEGERLALDARLIDFDDMISLPAHWNLRPAAQVDWLFVDECFTGDTLVTLADGTKCPIRTIVENRLPVSVLSYDERNSKVEVKRVTGWHKVQRRERRIVQIRGMQATADHPVYTREYGYLDASECLRRDVHVLELQREEIRSSRDAHRSGTFDHRWFATWRRLYPTGQVEGRGGKRAHSLHAGRAETRLSPVEARRISAMGDFANPRTKGDGVRREALRVCDHLPSTVHSDTRGSLSHGGGAEADYPADTCVARRSGSGGVVHGRRERWIFGRQDSDLRISTRGCGNSGDASSRAGHVVPSHGYREGRGSLLQRGGDALSLRANYTSHPSRVALQARHGRGTDLRRVRQVVSGAQDEHLPHVRNMRQLLQHNAGTSEATRGDDEWVYCLDVEDHHNFFADDILVHNCQDLSRAQLDTALRLLSPEGRFIGVGDPRQSIMAFSGADADSFYRAARHTNAQSLPLSICYRCPTAHLTLAREIVPQIEARPDAPEGVIEVTSTSKLPGIIQPGDMVICRLTAPLIAQCIHLIEEGIPARVRGRDIGKQLSSIVRAVENMPRYTWLEFGKWLTAFEASQIERLLQREDSASAVESMTDRCAAIRACYERFNAPDAATFRSEMEALFSDDRPSVMLSTVHRAKGLEAERVFILRPDTLPLVWPKQKPYEAEQEQHIRYVALTRATHALFWVY